MVTVTPRVSVSPVVIILRLVTVMTIVSIAAPWITGGCACQRIKEVFVSSVGCCTASASFLPQ
jgi:hypothetical protein